MKQLRVRAAPSKELWKPHTARAVRACRETKLCGACGDWGFVSSCDLSVLHTPLCRQQPGLLYNYCSSRHSWFLGFGKETLIIWSLLPLEQGGANPGVRWSLRLGRILWANFSLLFEGFLNREKIKTWGDFFPSVKSISFRKTENKAECFRLLVYLLIVSMVAFN